MKRMTDMRMLGLVLATASLAGCVTDPELVREERMQERARLLEMYENGECRERVVTGRRTRLMIECGEENREMTEAAQEGVRRMQDQGAICGGQNC